MHQEQEKKVVYVGVGGGSGKSFWDLLKTVGGELKIVKNNADNFALNVA